MEMLSRSTNSALRFLKFSARRTSCFECAFLFCNFARLMQCLGRTCSQFFPISRSGCMCAWSCVMYVTFRVFSTIFAACWRSLNDFLVLSRPHACVLWRICLFFPAFMLVLFEGVADDMTSLVWYVYELVMDDITVFLIALLINTLSFLHVAWTCAFTPQTFEALRMMQTPISGSCMSPRQCELNYRAFFARRSHTVTHVPFCCYS